MTTSPFPTSPAGRTAKNRTDTERLEWLLPIVTGVDTDETNAKVVAVSLMLMNNMEGRAAVDGAMDLTDK